ncbi:MAG TPA: SpoIVB peptidase S55 domain-containing protein, partial [Candidatus Ozemobacteraceae bacterium]|nr:SpoIVB peptidase S55 domain-containing protein [Candidatus Ozemobacteraceae bacterium]
MVYSSEQNARVLGVIAFLLLFAGFTASAQAQSDILAIKDVKVGMKGIGKTVIRGRDIETFNVEVLGILSNNKINENLQINGSSILVRVSGKVIDEAGGIAAGMSGSPIFVNGKLIGGLSSGWVMTDHTVGLVTPIEEMLEIWDYPLSASLPDKSKSLYWKTIDGSAIQIGQHRFNGIHQVADEDEAIELARTNQDAVFVEVAAPVVVQGLYDRAASLLKRKLGGKNVEVVAGSPGAGSDTITGPGTIEPGCAIGIQLARGDVNLTTLGTLTYRDGKRILGFAHPFLKKGNAAFLMTGAHIHHSFSSVQMPFKVGAPTEMIGIITQDREKGVAGELGRFPTLIPVQIEVIDRDLKRNRTINYQVVQDEGVFQSVIE